MMLPTAAMIPLTGMTAWQGITEELEARPGQALRIPGGIGRFGQMSVPIAGALELRVVVRGNDRARGALLAAGAERYLDYKKENCWGLSGVDLVIDTLGAGKFRRELAVLKPGSRAVLVCVYGYRAYEDAPTECQDITQQAGFRVGAAVAAVAEHSIARQIASGRPAPPAVHARMASARSKEKMRSIRSCGSHRS